MLKPRKRRKDASGEVTPVFENHPITDNTRSDPETGAPLPMEDEVILAKHWVDENEL